MANYLLEMYATDDVITDAEVNKTSFKQPDSKTSGHYTEALWEKAVGCGMVYKESRLKRICIDDIITSICYSIRTFRGGHREATIHSLVHHATNLVEF